MGVDGMEMDVDTSIPDPPAFVLLALHSAADASAHGHHRLALRMCVEVYQLLMDTLDIESLTVAQRANPLVIAHVEGGSAAAEPAATASASAAAAAAAAATAQRGVSYYDHREDEDEGGGEDGGYDEDYEFDNDYDDDNGGGDSGHGGHSKGGGAGRGI
jgi:hypothetical protein